MRQHDLQVPRQLGVLGLGFLCVVRIRRTMSPAQSLVEAHGSRVGTRAEPGGGALFFFEVPTAGAGTA